MFSISGTGSPDGVNKPYLAYFHFLAAPAECHTFDSQFFFPLDNGGMAGAGRDRGRYRGAGQRHKPHNYRLSPESTRSSDTAAAETSHSKATTISGSS